MTRYDYHTGLKSRQAALDAMDDALSESEISASECPKIEPYQITTTDGRKLDRWKITLAH
jgi:hypothetical protein